MVENFYNQGFADTFADDTTGMSQDERRFMQNAEKTQFKRGHYEIPLPFKNPEPLVPNNKSQALTRVGWLKKRLEKDSKLSDDYRAFMSDLLAKGYARKVPPVQASPVEGKAWYIPHHGVYHPHKPGKIRVVFDCSANFKGLSLNSMLHKGPDLTNSLVGVLTRFREDRVVVMADIEEMFYQVRVPDCNSSFLRFLWWEDGNMAQEVQEYQMLVHLFGAISSPACANFALRRSAEDNESCFPPEVINTVKINFYVDDCLKSLPSEAAAIAHVTNLQALLSRGGFKLTKWVSNSRKVLQSFLSQNVPRSSEALISTKTSYLPNALLAFDGASNQTSLPSTPVSNLDHLLAEAFCPSLAVSLTLWACLTFCSGSETSSSRSLPHEAWLGRRSSP